MLTLPNSCMLLMITVKYLCLFRYLGLLKRLQTIEQNGQLVNCLTLMYTQTQAHVHMHACTHKCTHSTYQQQQTDRWLRWYCMAGGALASPFLVVHKPSQGCLITARASAIPQHANTHIILLAHIPQLCLACMDKHSEKINPYSSILTDTTHSHTCAH